MVCIGSFNLVFICRISHLVLLYPLYCMQNENTDRVTSLPRRLHTPQSSNHLSSDGLVGRPPMVDISNKLHALVDEFVSNLSSECNSLAHNVSAEAHMYVAHDSALAGSQTQRTSNRTTSEVLNGLKRPSPDPLTSSCNIEGKSEVQHLNTNLSGREQQKQRGGQRSALQEGHEGQKCSPTGVGRPKSRARCGQRC